MSTNYVAPPPNYTPLPYRTLRATTDLIYRCPRFQRRYEWPESNNDMFWNDLMAAMDQSLPGAVQPIYLGALVFHHDPADRDVHLVIDGQQRLMSINLLLCAIHKVAHGYSWNDICNHTKKMLQGSDEHIRFWPTDFDMGPYEACLKDAQMQDKGQPLPARGRIPETYKRFIEKVNKALDNQLQSDRLKWLTRLTSEVIDDGLHFSPITIVGAQHKVTEVFDRLNRRGSPLTLMDLIRNEVFRRFGNNINKQEAVDLYNKQWKPFEEDLNKNYKAKDFFFPYALINKPNTTVNRAFYDTRSYWEQLLEDSSASNQSTAAEEPLEYAKILLSDMNEHVPAFLALSSTEPSASSNVDFTAFSGLEDELASLVRMNPLTRTSYSFLMKVLTAHKRGRLTAPFVKKVLRLVDSFLVRMTFAAREPTGLHAVFKTAYTNGKIEDFIGQKIDEPECLAVLVNRGLTSRTMPFPSDEDFRKNP